MDKKIAKGLVELKHKITNQSFVNEAKTVKEWAGADVIVRTHMSRDIKSWLSGDGLVLSLQDSRPCRRAVITQYSKELSWLFSELGTIFSSEIDYISKYDFYGLLAQSALDFLENNKHNECKNLLLEVINAINISELPDDMTLPFFAYGLFKPGQLCFFRIRNLVKSALEEEVHGILKERDAIPLLVPTTFSKIKGVLIYFEPGTEVEAYQRIIDIEPEEVYHWSEIKTESNINANVLLGRKSDRGSSDLEGFYEWDGKSDPFFSVALDEIEMILDQNSEFNHDYKTIFQLQMAYSLLWTAIERYAGLRYHLGEKVTKKIHNIADEKIFLKSLKKNIKAKRHVFSALDLKRYTLDPDNPKKAIDYYYQVRSNAIHRGKAVHRDFDTLKSSLKELLAIFNDLLNYAWSLDIPNK